MVKSALSRGSRTECRRVPKRLVVLRIEVLERSLCVYSVPRGTSIMIDVGACDVTLIQLPCKLKCYREKQRVGRRW